MKTLKPIFYYSVMTSNRGDMAIRKSIVNAIQKQLNIPFAFFNAKYEELTESRIQQLNNHSSGLMIAGSGLYSNYNTSSGWYFPCDTKLFNKIQRPIFLLGLGCNNNVKDDIFQGQLTERAKNSIYKINELASISTVRDIRTYNILKEIGIYKHKVLLDSACFLDVPHVSREKKVIINLAQHSPSLGRFDSNTTGQYYRNKNLQYFTKISNYLITEHGYQITFVTHDALEQSLVKDLQKTVPQLTSINTDNIDRMLHEYATAQFSIGIKMHSNILSFACGTPFISLYYDIKSQEFLKLLNYEEFGTNVFSDYYDFLYERVNHLLKQSDYYSTFFKLKRLAEEKLFNKLIQKVGQILKNENI